jgi:uncharacterized membrane-anchored protein
MSLLPLDDYPGRYALANELHARPFPELTAPCRAVAIAIKQPLGAAERDRAADVAHLTALLDRFGAPHPAPGAGHWTGKIGKAVLAWEMHTEFVTYTLFIDPTRGEPPFSDEPLRLFPEDWLAEAPGRLVTSCLVLVETASEEEEATIVETAFPEWFVPESLAASRVSEGDAVVASDFRIDARGNTRFAVLTRPACNPRRLGRMVQRLLEVEIYKSMAMLTLPRAREVAVTVARIDRQLADSVGAMAAMQGREGETLEELLQIAAELEVLASGSAFRFGAAGAYEAIVNQRIQVMREERVAGRQLLAEFMLRRFDPAMRTCRSAKARLDELSGRAGRAANLLRTRVDVANQAQNVEVLRAMDRRAAMQLRLQETVEGLSVVAISYYGVSLAAGVLAPLAERVGISHGVLVAGLTVPVLLVVWALVRRIRARLARRSGHGG